MDDISNGNRPSNGYGDEIPYGDRYNNPRRRWGLWIVLFASAILAGSLARNLNASNGVTVAVRSGARNDIIHLEEKNIPSFKAAGIITTSADVELIPADCFGIEIRMPAAFEPEWKVENDRLVFRQTNPVNANIGVSMTNNRRYVKIYYPEGTVFDDIHLQTTSGNITVSAESNRGRLTVKATSGYVRADVSGAAEAAIHTSSGNIMSSLHDTADVYLTASYGKVETGVDGCDTVTIKTTSGNVSVTNDDEKAVMLSVNVSSGKIEADGKAWINLSTESSSGDIRIKGALWGDTSVRTSSGRVELTVKGRASQYGYNLNTVSSGAAIHWDGNRLGKPARSSGSFEHTIEISTSSGGIKVDFD
jgi:DUF4097 and DUF4098 domain-containing protein YvlB